MKNKISILAIGLLITIASCSDQGKNDESTSKTEEVKIATVDTTNILIAVVCQNGKFGFIGTDLKFIIQPQFDHAMEFSEGLACVKSGEKWGFVNINGEFVIPATYDYPGVFHDGLAKVGNHKSEAIGTPRYIFIDKTGKNVFGEKYTYAEDFNNKVTKVKTEDYKEKYLDVTGKELEREYVNAHYPLLYNHFKHSIRPYGGELTKSIVLDEKTGQPKDLKYDKKNYGYLDELGHPATGADYCFAGEFKYSYKTPEIYITTNKTDTIAAPGSNVEITAAYVRTESIDIGDNPGIKIIFKTESGEEISFDGYNEQSKTIPLFFICGKCESPDLTVKSSVGLKYTVKYSVQKAEGSGGLLEEFKTLENASPK